jgi:excisionase family DNA binding protein
MSENKITELLTIDELATLLRVPRSWIYDKTRVSKQNGFPVLRVGKYLRFESQKVLDWLNKGD